MEAAQPSPSGSGSGSRNEEAREAFSRTDDRTWCQREEWE